MYLKKVDGPRSVKLPDGSVLSVSDLPESSTPRWVASRKEIVVKAIFYGLITRASAIERYALSEEELENWESAYVLKGRDGLKVTRIQITRQP